MKNEILSEMVTLRQLFDGRYVKYVKEYFAKSDDSGGHFVVFNKEGNKYFSELENLIAEYESKTIGDIIPDNSGKKEKKEEICEVEYKCYKSQKILIKIDDKWLVNQRFIDYAESKMFEKGNELGELKAAINLIEKMQKNRQPLIMSGVEKASSESDSFKLHEILRNNQNSSVFKYLLQRQLSGIVSETAILQTIKLMTDKSDTAVNNFNQHTVLNQFKGT
jgi:hypothetical protein